VVVKKAESISVIKERHNVLTTVSKEYFQVVINQAGLRRAGRVPTAVDPDMGSFFFSDLSKHPADKPTLPVTVEPVTQTS